MHQSCYQPDVVVLREVVVLKLLKEGQYSPLTLFGVVVRGHNPSMLAHSFYPGVRQSVLKQM